MSRGIAHQGKNIEFPKESAVSGGVYRWVEVREGVEIWQARIDRSRGEWATITQEGYEAENLTPNFWDLPLKDDYLQEVLNEGFSSTS